MADAPFLASTIHARPAGVRSSGRWRHRRWRRRGRKGQVAAVATILGLLLVVTFIANYLSTTLPQQMSLNDLDHNLQVENQLGRFQALLRAVSVQGDVGAQVTQPVTLGSQGLPPFADADSGSLSPLNGSNYSLSYQLAGPSFFNPPSTGTAGGAYSSGCTLTSTSALVTFACATAGHARYNFTGTPTTGFTATSAVGGTYALNFSTNGTSTTAESIGLTSTAGTSTWNVYVYGSNDTITLTTVAGAATFDLIEFGTNDTVKITATAGTTTVNLLSVGYKNAITAPDATAVVLNAYVAGWDDTVAAPTADETAATAFTVYFTGFSASAIVCPRNNLAATDSVSGSDATGTYVAYYNVTTTFTPTAVTHWTQHVDVTTPVASGCPLFTTVTVRSPTAPVFAGLNAQLHNTYAPVADIAFDAGAVVVAQPGGLPQIIDAPGISVVNTTAGVTSVSLWFPVFIGKGAAEAGVQSAILSARLVALTSYSLTPQTSYTVANNTDIVLTVNTPFAAGWWSYFNQTYPANWISCVGHGCFGLFTGVGDFGTVSLTIPTGTKLVYFNVDIATFSFAPA